MNGSLPQGSFDRPPAFVVNRGDCNGYGVLRNLALEGVPVVSLDSNPQNVTFLSRFVHKCICPDWGKKPGEFIEFLIKIGKEQKYKPVLYPTGDIDLLTITSSLRELKPYYHIPVPEQEIVETLVDKSKFYNYLNNINIPHPKTYYLNNNINSVYEITKQIKFPCILKPTISKLENSIYFKCRRINSTQELFEYLHIAKQCNTSILIQEEVPGEERYLVYTFFNRSGEMRAYCIYKKIRLNPIEFGNACVCETVENKEVVHLAATILKNLRYKGLAEAEIQYDPEINQFKVIEINARTTTQTRLSQRAGLNMEYLAYRDVLGLPLPAVNRPQTGIKWIHIIKDFDAIFQQNGYLVKRKLNIRQWLSSFRGKKTYAMFAWDDILPFLFWTRYFFKPYLHNKNFISIFFYIFRKIKSKFIIQNVKYKIKLPLKQLQKVKYYNVSK